MYIMTSLLIPHPVISQAFCCQSFPETLTKAWEVRRQTNHSFSKVDWLINSFCEEAAGECRVCQRLRAGSDTQLDVFSNNKDDCSPSLVTGIITTSISRLFRRFVGHKIRGRYIMGNILYLLVELESSLILRDFVLVKANISKSFGPKVSGMLDHEIGSSVMM